MKKDTFSIIAFIVIIPLVIFLISQSLDTKEDKSALYDLISNELLKEPITENIFRDIRYGQVRTNNDDALFKEFEDFRFSNNKNINTAEWYVWGRYHNDSLYELSLYYSKYSSSDISPNKVFTEAVNEYIKKYGTPHLEYEEEVHWVFSNNHIYIKFSNLKESKSVHIYYTNELKKSKINWKKVRRIDLFNIYDKEIYDSIMKVKERTEKENINSDI